jgi:uncharacterized protein (TIGR03118 family)
MTAKYIRNCRRLLVVAAPLTLLFGVAFAGRPVATGYRQFNLVSDVPGRALRTDPNLVNAWGMSFSATGPFWISSAEKGVSVLYDRAGRPFPRANRLIVTIPPPAGSPPGTTSAPTGQLFNGTGDFAVSPGKSAFFIFVTEDGTISGWNPTVNAKNAILMVDNSAFGAIYKGVTMANFNGHNFLFAADFHNGTIDTYDASFNPVFTISGTSPMFTDPNLPAGYAPFNISNIGGQIYVTYAVQDANAEDDVPNPGNGIVDVYGADGTFVKRLISNAQLNSPWGIAIAPATFGVFANALLVGNFGDGKVNAFDPGTGAYLGTIADTHGNPIVIDGLWALSFGGGGNNAVSGRANTLYFTAGPDDEAHGLFGQINTIPGGDE